MPETGETGPRCLVCGYPVGGEACGWCGANQDAVRRIALVPSPVGRAGPLDPAVAADIERAGLHRSEAIWSILSPEFRDGTLGQYRPLRLRAASFAASVMLPAMFIGFCGGFWAGAAAAARVLGDLRDAAPEASRWIAPVFLMIPAGLVSGFLAEALAARGGPGREERRFLEAHALVAPALVRLGREPWYLRPAALGAAAFAAAVVACRIALGML